MDDRSIVFNLKEAGRVGPRTMIALLRHFQSAQAIWEASPEELREIPRIGRKTVEQIVEGRKQRDHTLQMMMDLEEQDIQVITLVDREYPLRLRMIGDPPSVVYVRGTLNGSETPTVAVVGTHEADAEGILSSENWGDRLAREGATIVSGLARGVDAAAHVGAMQAGGRPLAVLGCGFTRLYPPEHGELAGQIAENGAVISEYRPDTSVSVGRLMARNRLVVGLSDAVLIVQVHESSTGTMDAAHRCYEQGKPLYVLERDHIPQIGALKSCGAVLVNDMTGISLILDYL